MSAERVRGCADGLGIKLVPVGTALTMSEADFQRVAKALAHRRQAEPLSA